MKLGRELEMAFAALRTLATVVLVKPDGLDSIIISEDESAGSSLLL